MALDEPLFPPCLGLDELLPLILGLAAEFPALILFLRIRLMLETLGTLNLSQMPSLTSRSLISQAKMPGSRLFRSRMNKTTLIDLGAR